MPSQVLRTQNKTNKKSITTSGRERIDNKWAPQNQICQSLDLEKKGQHEILPSFLNQALWRSRALTLVRILSLHQFLPVFPGFHLFKGVTGSHLPENPSGLSNLERSPSRDCPLKVDMGHSSYCGRF